MSGFTGNALVDALIEKKEDEKLLKQLLEHIKRIGLRQEAFITAWNAFTNVDGVAPPDVASTDPVPYDPEDFQAIGGKTITPKT